MRWPSSRRRSPTPPTCKNSSVSDGHVHAAPPSYTYDHASFADGNVHATAIYGDWSINIYNINGEIQPSTETNAALRNDLEQMETIVQDMLKIIKRDEAWNTQFRYHYVLQLTLLNYVDKMQTRTNYVTTPTLIRLTAVAALVSVVGQIDGEDWTTQFLHLLALGDAILLQAQREAKEIEDGINGNEEYRDMVEYQRLLDHGDYWQERRWTEEWDGLDGENLRRKWIVGLRIRVRGRGAPWFAPETPAPAPTQASTARPTPAIMLESRRVIAEYGGRVAGNHWDRSHLPLPVPDVPGSLFLDNPMDYITIYTALAIELQSTENRRSATRGQGVRGGRI